jgi:hypothetical protein
MTAKKKAVASVYILTGSTGEYGDHFEWSVRVYLYQADAQAECDALNALCAEHKLSTSSTKGTTLRTRFAKYIKPRDPNGRIDYAGVSYRVYAVELYQPEATNDR